MGILTWVLVWVLGLGILFAFVLPALFSAASDMSCVLALAICIGLTYLVVYQIKKLLEEKE